MTVQGDLSPHGSTYVVLCRGGCHGGRLMPRQPRSRRLPLPAGRVGAAGTARKVMVAGANVTVPAATRRLRVAAAIAGVPSRSAVPLSRSAHPQVSGIQRVALRMRWRASAHAAVRSVLMTSSGHRPARLSGNGHRHAGPPGSARRHRAPSFPSIAATATRPNNSAAAPACARRAGRNRSPPAYCASRPARPLWPAGRADRDSGRYRERSRPRGCRRRRPRRFR